jgi:hypothetical protein
MLRRELFKFAHEFVRISATQIKTFSDSLWGASAQK